MAVDLMAIVNFSDGTVGSFVKEGATAETVTSITTGGTGLNQASGIECGQAFPGKQAVSAVIMVQADNAATAVFSYGYFQGPDGKIMCPVQGGSAIAATSAPALPFAVTMTPGVTLNGCFDTVVDGPSLASLAVVCSDRTSDVFFVKAVAATKTAMVNKDGSTIGQALTNKQLESCYATHASTYGVNEDGAGVGFYYVESAEGQLKGAFPAGFGGAYAAPVPYQAGYRVRILQNDTLSVMGTT